MSPPESALGVKIFADGGDLADLLELYANPAIRGFTTNPTLMRKAGVDDYLGFAKKLLAVITDRPISFEVTSDDFPEMERQAMTLHSLGDNVYVKIPITDTDGSSTALLMRRLADEGVSVNATAITTLDQVATAADALGGGPPAIVSVFAGRIADTGVDPVPVMATAKDILRADPELELLWASPREILNLIQADQAGCDIITITPALLAKLSWLGRDLDDVSLATVKMFRDDAVASLYEF